MPNWVRVAEIREVPADGGLERVVAGRIIGLFCVDDHYFAIDGICAHQGGPVGKGGICGAIVTCPWHGWQYDVTSGKHELSEIRQQTFPVERRGDELFVDMEERGS
ncbi:Rieske (2Fe-2S) protein [Blastopirellula sp. J2-11]|uniref:Rieske (2Fe-2S) protein n=1 Tax=Blastopirellula sp. J2-11 TaxID=2943192 RepID=UPI0021CAE0E8|nr:Rieske (2Fe-2S) protein [Blastopirellula sp. J2-11]UUO09073.1 Rieske (2Fe-2S) protein [Blastopirellula sp. J2-11]